VSQRYALGLWINEARYDLDVGADMTLLEVLREDLRLTGTKANCEQGECGACTVLIDGRAVDACLTLALSIPESHVTTIEGLARDGQPSPVQRAFIESDAAQCGYCTPGMVLAATALLDAGGPLTRDSILKGLEGNYCRCTGYNSIIAAIEDAARGRPEG
jgi:aerobic-type carbon monoxide dehydrogenase small subunit (CoxS/CutS family)